jgi:hypothetical protein
MSNHVSYAVLTVVLLGGIPAANAQDVIVQPLSPGAAVTRSSSTVETVPVETVETVQTVRSVGHGGRRAISHHLVRSRPETIVTTTTRRTILGERVIPAPTVVEPAPPVPAVAEPAYADVVEAPPAYSPLYDVATPPAAVVTEPVVGAPVAPAYRYVYEPDRILVVDPVTGIAVQAIPR